MNNFPKVSIVILNYNGKQFILEVLNSVLKINYPNFEVVLVDNGSTDGSLELVKKSFSKIVFIKNSENIGFSAGNNIGIKYSLERGAKYVLLLNYDTQVKRNFLVNLVAIMERDKKIGISSPIIFKNKSSQLWFAGGKINWLKMKSRHQTKMIKTNYKKSDFISGCAMLVKREVFQEVGLLDEDFFLYWEDVDFSVRAKRKGFNLLVSPKSQIYHFEKSEERNKIKVYWLVLSGLIFFKKNTPLVFKPWIFSYTLIRKIKNWRDFKFHPQKTAKLIKKAYQDFKYVK